MTHCNALQHTATHCNTLQHTATHCNTLQHTAVDLMCLEKMKPSRETIKIDNTQMRKLGEHMRSIAVCCSALQCVAACCSVLQCVICALSVLYCLAMAIRVLLLCTFPMQTACDLSRATILLSKRVQQGDETLLLRPRTVAIWGGFD